MTEEDRRRWDDRYRLTDSASLDETGPAGEFASCSDLFPRRGSALELACGDGRGAVWLASRGMDVQGVDVSPVAVGLARGRARAAGVGDRCRFDVVDLDEGLPEGPLVDLLVCHLYRDPDLVPAMIERVKPGGLIALAVLSEVGSRAGRFRARRGELVTFFSGHEVLAQGEGGGAAWILAVL